MSDETKHIVFNGQPKAGNHLLFRIAEVFGYGYPNEFKFWDKTLKGGEFMFWHQHLPWSKTAEERVRNIGAKMIVIYRDPRDVLASHVRAVKASKKSSMQYQKYLIEMGVEKFVNEAMIGFPDADDTGAGTSMIEYRTRWLNWKSVDYVLPVKFENLVGSQGGGNDAAQLKSFTRICQFIGLKVDNYEEDVKKLYSPESTTFVKGGKIGNWKDVLTEDNIIQLKRIVGNLVEEMGYG